MIRQLTVARASCGRALSAWPPDSRGGWGGGFAGRPPERGGGEGGGGGGAALRGTRLEGFCPFPVVGLGKPGALRVPRGPFPPFLPLAKIGGGVFVEHRRDPPRLEP